jgi:hypothetical protein
MQGFWASASQWLTLAMGSAAVLLLLGYLWAHFGRLPQSKMAGKAALVASVLAVIGIFIVQKMGLTPGRNWLDGLVLFWVCWFHAYFMCWGGMFLGKRQQYAKKATPSAFGFKQSSILSMQFMDSRDQGDGTEIMDRGILETEFQVSQKPAASTPPKTPPAA